MRQTTKQNLMERLFIALFFLLFGDLIWLVYEPHIWHVAAWPILVVCILAVCKWLEKNEKA